MTAVERRAGRSRRAKLDRVGAAAAARLRLPLASLAGEHHVHAASEPVEIRRGPIRRSHDNTFIVLCRLSKTENI